MRVGIIGAGVVGLSHAWLAAEHGHQVTIFDRSSQAAGASIRNFGMVWPIGQPLGELYALALRSRWRWLTLQQEAKLWVNPCGSLHLAHREDEWQVLQEFVGHSATRDLGLRLLTPEQVMGRTPAANPVGLFGGMFSPAELCVDPTQAIRALPNWLKHRFPVQLRFGTAVVAIENTTVVDSGLQRWEFDRIVVCSGSDIRTLFPETLATSGIKLCKLQMLRTVSQPAQWSIGSHLASGLTLRHYRNFEICPSLPRLQARIATETPELDRFGIHVMASQGSSGSVTLGDSHEYDEEIEPFDKAQIDALILRELKKIIQLPDWTIDQHWHGIYAKYPTGPIFEAEPIPNVLLRTGTGGSGMTMAFGLAEKDWMQWQ